MSVLVAIGLAVWASGGKSLSSESYQLPGLQVCAGKACLINLDDQGYLVDSASGKRIFAKPVEETMFNTYSLFRSDNKYVIELENTTSSRNWGAVVFSYKDGIVNGERYISISRSFSPGAEQEVQWAGIECRGSANLEKSSNPFESASISLCGNNKDKKFIKLDDTTLIKKAMTRGLVVEMPVYEKLKQNVSHATYFFPGADEPDAGALLCLKGCGVGKDSQRLGGWIGKYLWIDINVRDVGEKGKYVGSYAYLGKDGQIPLDGDVDGIGLKLNEYLPTDVSRRQPPTALLIGARDGDAFVGTWSSKENTKSFEMVLAQRIY